MSFLTASENAELAASLHPLPPGYSDLPKADPPIFSRSDRHHNLKVVKGLLGPTPSPEAAQMYAALLLAKTLKVWQALLAGEPVHPSAIDPSYLAKFRKGGMLP